MTATVAPMPAPIETSARNTGATPIRPGSLTRRGVAPVFLALVSMGAGIGATVAVIQPAYPGRMNGVQAILVALIWIVIGAINISYARRS